MKIRRGFVSNSSSSSFAITNKTGQEMTLKDFFIKYKEEIIRLLSEHSYWKWETENGYLSWEKLLDGAEKLDTEDGGFLPGIEVQRSYTNESDNPTDGFLRSFFDVVKPFDDTWAWSLRWNDQAGSNWDCEE